MRDLSSLRRANDQAALQELARHYLCACGTNDPAAFRQWLIDRGHGDLAELHRQLRAE